MADVLITIPDTHFERVASALAQQRGHDISSMGKDEWITMLRRDVVDYWINIVSSAEGPAYRDEIRQSMTDMIKEAG